MIDAQLILDATINDTSAERLDKLVSGDLLFLLWILVIIWKFNY